ncbi:MAG: hypothetical protein RIT27_774 [Pseudomonadota bacterium]|jgi:hypothetical protein
MLYAKGVKDVWVETLWETHLWEEIHEYMIRSALIHNNTPSIHPNSTLFFCRLVIEGLW